MGGESRNSFQFKCPFYKEHNEHKSIACNGIIPGTKIINVFASPELKQRQMKYYCCNIEGYEYCPLYETLEWLTIEVKRKK